MPVAIQRGGVIPGMIVLIVAAAGAWSLFGACPAHVV
jgi:amino acid permease